MIAILDLDGTLVDSNYHHVLSWSRALRDHGVVVPLWRIHRAIGIGGDDLVTHVCGEEVERDVGDAVRQSEGEHYFGGLIDEVQPLDGARELVLALKRRSHRVVLASSGKAEEVDHYLDMLAARALADAWTTSDDVQAAKPAPDLVVAALEKVGGEPSEAILVGDTPWDVKAAEAAGVPTLGLLTGGFSAGELEEAGAERVFEAMTDLVARIEETPFGPEADTAS